MKCLFHGEDCWLDRADAKARNCDDITDKEERLRCKFEEIYKVTEKQDVMNIDLIKDLNNDSDERWIPLHMIDNANAVILGISRNRGRPKLIVNEGYVGDKLESLMGKWTMIRLRDAKLLCAWRGCTHQGVHYFRGQYYCKGHHDQLERQVKFREVSAISTDEAERYFRSLVVVSDNIATRLMGVRRLSTETQKYAQEFVDKLQFVVNDFFGRTEEEWQEQEEWTDKDYDEWEKFREEGWKEFLTEFEACLFHGEDCWLTDSKIIIGSTGEHYWRGLLPQIEPGSTVKIDVLVSPNFLQKEKIRISFNGEERLFGYTDWRYESMVSAFEKKGRQVKARIIHGEAS